MKTNALILLTLFMFCGCTISRDDTDETVRVKHVFSMGFDLAMKCRDKLSKEQCEVVLLNVLSRI